MIPESAIVREGERTFAWRIKGNVLQKVALTLGDRDTRRGDFVVRGGLGEGDRLLRHPVSLLKDGQGVKETASAQAASPMPEAAKSTTP